jgi:HSP20 family protein
MACRASTRRDDARFVGSSGARGDSTMMNGWNDFERSLALLDDMRRQMDRLWDEFDGSQRSTPLGTSWPRVNVVDAGETLRVDAEVPGLGEKDVQVSVQNDVLTLEGERRVRAPEGFTPHRQERASVRFNRAVALPCKVDLERITASMKDGVLTITCHKAPESRPRQIAVKTV